MYVGSVLGFPLFHLLVNTYILGDKIVILEADYNSKDFFFSQRNEAIHCFLAVIEI